MKPYISIDAKARHVLVPSAAAFLVIVMVLFAMSRVSSLLSTLAFVLLSVAVAAGFAAHVLFWRERGVRRVEISGETLTLRAGRSLLPRNVERPSVARLRVTSRLGLRVATLHLAAGGRVRISGDAFSEEDFSRMLSALEEWGPPPDKRRTRGS